MGNTAASRSVLASLKKDLIAVVPFPDAFNDPNVDSTNNNPTKLFSSTKTAPMPMEGLTVEDERSEEAIAPDKFVIDRETSCKEISKDEENSYDFSVTEGQSRRELMAENEFLCSEILPWLFVGGAKVAESLSSLRKYNIKRVINCSASVIPNFFIGSGEFKYLSLSMIDGRQDDISWFLCEVVQFIFEGKLQGENCLLHCEKGISRSCSYAIAFHMWFSDSSWRNSFNFVKTRRTVCNPNTSFTCNLIEIDELIHGDARFSTVLFRCAHHLPHDRGTAVLKICRQFETRKLHIPRLSILDPRGVFVIRPPEGQGDCIYVWQGSLASNETVEKTMAIAKLFIGIYAQAKDLLLVQENEEPDGLFDVLEDHLPFNVASASVIFDDLFLPENKNNNDTSTVMEEVLSASQNSVILSNRTQDNLVGMVDSNARGEISSSSALVGSFPTLNSTTKEESSPVPTGFSLTMPIRSMNQNANSSNIALSTTLPLSSAVDVTTALAMKLDLSGISKVDSNSSSVDDSQMQVDEDHLNDRNLNLSTLPIDQNEMSVEDDNEKDGIKVNFDTPRGDECVDEPVVNNGCRPPSPVEVNVSIRKSTRVPDMFVQGVTAPMHNINDGHELSPVSTPPNKIPRIDLSLGNSLSAARNSNSRGSSSRGSYDQTSSSRSNVITTPSRSKEHSSVNDSRTLSQLSTDVQRDHTTSSSNLAITAMSDHMDTSPPMTPMVSIVPQGVSVTISPSKSNVSTGIAIVGTQISDGSNSNGGMSIVGKSILTPSRPSNSHHSHNTVVPLGLPSGVTDSCSFNGSYPSSPMPSSRVTPSSASSPDPSLAKVLTVAPKTLLPASQANDKPVPVLSLPFSLSARLSTPPLSSNRVHPLPVVTTTSLAPNNSNSNLISSIQHGGSFSNLIHPVEGIGIPSLNVNNNNNTTSTNNLIASGRTNSVPATPPLPLSRSSSQQKGIEKMPSEVGLIRGPTSLEDLKSHVEPTGAPVATEPVSGKPLLFLASKEDIWQWVPLGIYDDDDLLETSLLLLVTPSSLTCFVWIGKDSQLDDDSFSDMTDGDLLSLILSNRILQANLPSFLDFKSWTFSFQRQDHESSDFWNSFNDGF